MDYTIDIVDTIDANLTLTLEKALRGSVQLSWLGADAKDDLIVVGSSLQFTMIDPEHLDGKFDRFFTGNETRYWVHLYNENNATIWQGFLLPDSYSEPYENGSLVVGFTATDGLGRLKGKFLTDDFYEEEKSVIQLIAACLKETGLQLDILFTPAIENSLEKSYNAIYLDGNLFVDGDTKLSAYDILQQLMSDMICCVYQADNCWYVDALNKRHLRTVEYTTYNYLGEYQNAATLTRLLKESIPLVTPVITMVAPYGGINVNYNSIQQTLPDTIDNESNDGWAVINGIDGKIYATDWSGNNNYYARAISPDYDVALPVVWGESTADIDATKYIDLLKKLYVVKGSKFTFKIELTPQINSAVPKNQEAFEANGTKCEIIINGEIVNTFAIAFSEGDNEDSFKFDFDVVAQSSGLMDIKIYQPFCEGIEAWVAPYFLYFLIKKIEFSQVGFNGGLNVSDVINEDYTIQKDIDLTFNDDKRGIDSAFRLAKLNETSPTYSEITVPILYGFVQDNLNYSVVLLEGANLISDHLKFVYYNTELVPNLEVIYNFKDGEQMVVKTDDLIDSGEFKVRIYETNTVSEDRAYWEQWTDSIYKIETDRYIDCVANVNRRMFNVPHYKIDMTVNQSLKFNDIITFPYKRLQNYFISNCTWMIDLGEANISAIKGYYKNDVVINPDDNIQPVVNAGEDLFLEGADTTTVLNAVAYDPDGFIVSYQWVQLSGDPVVIANPNQATTNISNLTGDDYEFEITVTDNNGATGTDTVKVARNKTYTLSTTTDCVVYEDYVITGFPNPFNRKRKIVTFNIAPDLNPGTSINVKLNIDVFDIATLGTDAEVNAPGCGRIIENGFLCSGVVKNGVIIANFYWSYKEVTTVNFNAISGDVIQFQMEAAGEEYAQMENFSIEVIEAVDVDGNSIINGLPIKIEMFDTYTLP